MQDKGKYKFKVSGFSTGIIGCCLYFFMTFQMISADVESYHEAVEPEEYDLIEFHQQDGTQLHIKGWRYGQIHYTETKDGYTIVLNDYGVYEYAEHTEDGDLKPSGVKANDPGGRTDAEKDYLKDLGKQKRFKESKLKEIGDDLFFEFHH